MRVLRRIKNNMDICIETFVRQTPYYDFAHVVEIQPKESIIKCFKMNFTHSTERAGAGLKITARLPSESQQ